MEKAGVPAGIVVVLAIAWSLSVLVLVLAFRTWPRRWIKLSLGVFAGWTFVVSALMTYAAVASM